MVIDGNNSDIVTIRDSSGTEIGTVGNPLNIQVVGGINGVAGAVTIADGADTAEGTKADAAWTSGSGTVISLLKAIAGNIITNPGFYYQTHNYTTAAGTNTSVDMTGFPASSYSLQVAGESSINAPVLPTSWTVLLEGSLNNVDWVTILSHASGTQSDGAVVSVADKPMRYMRMNCSALSLNTADHIQVSIVAKT